VRGLFKNFLLSPCYKSGGHFRPLAYNVSGLCVVALSRNLKLTTTFEGLLRKTLVMCRYYSQDESRNKEDIKGTRQT
jgi:hypothetical protein